MRKVRNRIVHHQSKISRIDPDWKIIEDYITKHNDWIEFKENLYEKDEDGNLYYSDKHKYAFTFLIKD